MPFPFPLNDVIAERSKQHSFCNMDTGQYEKDGHWAKWGPAGAVRQDWAAPELTLGAGGGGGHQSHPMSHVSGGWPSPDRSQITQCSERSRDWELSQASFCWLGPKSQSISALKARVSFTCFSKILYDVKANFLGLILIHHGRDQKENAVYEGRYKEKR